MNASSPTTFDPVAYVADMRAACVELVPFTVAHNSRRLFSIRANPVIPFDVVTIGTKWEAAALAHDDWQAAVRDALVAEEGALCSPA